MRILKTLKGKWALIQLIRLRLKTANDNRPQRGLLSSKRSSVKIANEMQAITWRLKNEARQKRIDEALEKHRRQRDQERANWPFPVND